MEYKKTLLNSLPFAIFSAIILLSSLLTLINIKIGTILIFISLSCQNLYIGLKLYKQNIKQSLFYILYGLFFFIFTIWAALKIYNLGLM
jgi:hypothetical protein